MCRSSSSPTRPAPGRWSTALPATVGFDIESEPLPEHAPPPIWLAITKSGRLAVRQPTSKDKTALDPHRARPRLAQIYDPRAGVVYVVDLRAVPIAVLEGLWSRRLIIHNAAFEIVDAARPAARRGRHDAAGRPGLRHRPGRPAAGHRRRGGARITVPKDLQTSDWSASRLSEAQLRYAALDAVVAYRAARVLWRGLEPDARPAFTAQNNAVPVIARMRLVGIPFDPEIHRATIAAWEVEQAEARAAFVAAAGEEVPQQGPKRSLWLLRRLQALGADATIGRWPRTATGALATGAEHLKRIADRSGRAR